MKVLVTGANGFIGSALCTAICNHGDSLRMALRHPYPNGPSSDTVRIDAVGPNTAWNQALQGRDVVIHLAARAHVMSEHASDPLAAYRSVNTDGTLHLARQAAAAGVKRFVFISSVKVHGEATAPGQAFQVNGALYPQDPYGTSKYEAEQGLFKIAQETGMEVTTIRPPLVYGPGVKANFAALLKAVSHRQILPLGAIHNLRSLVAVDNLVDFIRTCMVHPAAANQTFLVSDGEDISTTDLVRRMAQSMGLPAHLLPIPAWMLITGATLLGKRAAAQRLCGNLQVDISKARTQLGWTPPVSVDEGLRRAVASYRP